jgi:hypothetical protein
MRRAAIAAVAVGIVLLLAPSYVLGLTLLGVLVALPLGAIALVGRRVRRGETISVPWMVSLVLSALITAPEVALARYRSADAEIISGFVWWLSLTAILRLAIFLADYIRRRRGAPAAEVQPDGER